MFRKELGKIARHARSVHTNDSLLNNLDEVVNRNPRNLELMRIAKKPRGFILDDKKQEFWHKLDISKFSRYIIAEVRHFENGVVVSASSKEPGISKQLYSLTDAAAYINIGRVIGQRCIQSGIFQVRCDIDPENSEKSSLFMKSAAESGLSLTESPIYIHALPQSQKRQQKPWLVYD